MLLFVARLLLVKIAGSRVVGQQFPRENGHVKYGLELGCDIADIRFEPEHLVTDACNRLDPRYLLSGEDPEALEAVKASVWALYRWTEKVIEHVHSIDDAALFWSLIEELQDIARERLRAGRWRRVRQECLGPNPFDPVYMFGGPGQNRDPLDVAVVWCKDYALAKAFPKKPPQSTAPTTRSIGSEIQRRRNELGWTQENVADEAKVSRFTVMRYEDGRNFDPATMKSILSVLGLKLEDFAAPNRKRRKTGSNGRT